MAVITALIPNPVRLGRLRLAAREGHTVIPCDGWDELFHVAERQLVHIAVLDLEAAGAPNFDPVRRLKLLSPRVALVAYVVLTPDKIRHIFDAGRYGFEELVVADVDDGPSAFGRAIDKAAARGVAALVRKLVPTAPNTVARDALMVSVTRAHERLTPTMLASIRAARPLGCRRAMCITRAARRGIFK